MQTGDRVRPPTDRDPAPLGGEGGMVAGTLGQGADPVREGQRLDEVRKAKRPLEPWDAVALDDAPARDLGLQRFDFGRGHAGTVRTTLGAVLIRQLAHACLSWAVAARRAPSIVARISPALPLPLRDVSARPMTIVRSRGKT